MIDLPSLSRMDLAYRHAGPRVWLAVEPADMRWGFDRLAELARTVIGQNPLSGNLFVFRSRRCDRLKVLYWDSDGYALWYKRLEEGTFRLPRVEANASSIERRASELAMLLEGIDLRSLKRVKRFVRESS